MPGHPSDAGFTLTEILVAVALIGVVMSSVTPFFVSSVSVTNGQRGKQTAVQLASDAMERVRALKGSAIVAGREQCDVGTCASPVPGVERYLANTQEWDQLAPGITPALPITVNGSQPGESVVVNGVTYGKNWYVGRCWQSRAGGNCLSTIADAEFFRVVVAVTWRDRVCPASTCTHIVSTLVSSAATEPMFNSGDTAQAPVMTNPGPQVGEVSVPLGSAGPGGPAPTVQLTASGGTSPLTFDAPMGLPPGLTLDRTSGLITGTPTTSGTYPVTVSVTDAFQLTDAVSFTWTINDLPALTNPGPQVTTVGATESLAIPLTGGTGPMTWSATGLPAGLSINAATGAVTGKPTTASTQSVTATVKDTFNKSARVTFSWLVNPAPAVTNPGKQLMAEGTPVSLPLKGTGGTGALTWSASGLPAGLSINPTTGLISGTPAETPQTGVRVTVTVTDARGVPGSTTFIWDVLGIRTNNMGDSVNLQFLLPGGVKPVITTAVDLPTGLTISNSGLATGTITGGTRFLPRLSLTDANGKVWPWLFIWQVNDPTGLRIIAPTGDRATDPVGQSISPLTAKAAGGSGTGYTWTATGLPAGVGISPTGVIKGTPTTAGSYIVQLTVKDSTGKTATFTFTWGIQ